ncbi:spore coat protein GerQ [Domibacillus sp. DTU_2020_1001157_1_SI_ALB_TIR_016]|uniref:spore coat protein GerQ n=1 Tax=Domibacillus sp. DTU_2020_1001157_1_SI_ALB_TIR_016 TaxID=3077789 RepID=UPI0028E76EE8|nr:spore coat protein GerQ [Domibacillus sp. DTU_2020_1001157_1_SI_ALB_TIR_016]WNS81077.1 spore coat protein GerQ [Domibacillus sp. DTU_2020_1001157_1_SI_ALB_TIR_016]
MNPFHYVPAQGPMNQGSMNQGSMNQTGPQTLPPVGMGQGMAQGMGPGMGQGMGPGGGAGLPQVEESYIENIFRLNRGKMVTVYTTFENNKEWNAKVFRGRIEAAGRDHLILSSPSTNQRFLIPLLYLDYAVFDGEIAYEYPFS